MFWTIIFLIAECAITTIGYYKTVSGTAKERIYNDENDTPNRPVALLLGTSPIGRSRNPNKFFFRCINAAAELYSAGKYNRLAALRNTMSLGRYVPH